MGLSLVPVQVMDTLPITPQETGVSVLCVQADPHVHGCVDQLTDQKYCWAEHRVSITRVKFIGSGCEPGWRDAATDLLLVLSAPTTYLQYDQQLQTLIPSPATSGTHTIVWELLLYDKSATSDWLENHLHYVNLSFSILRAQCRAPLTRSAARCPPIKTFMDDTDHQQSSRQQNLVTWARMSFKPAKSRSMLLNEGKVVDKFHFSLFEILSITDKPVKSLGKNIKCSLCSFP